MTKVWRAWRALTFLLVLFIIGCAREPLTSQESFVFGTRVEVLVYGAPPETARSAAAAVLRQAGATHITGLVLARTEAITVHAEDPIRD